MIEYFLICAAIALVAIIRYIIPKAAKTKYYLRYNPFFWVFTFSLLTLLAPLVFFDLIFLAKDYGERIEDFMLSKNIS